MARPLRIEYEGAVYHITSRGNARQDIFLDDQDRLSFLTVLGDVVARYNWGCHAYCLMPNHYHPLIETPEANLSCGMRQLNGVYTQAFNRRHNRVGHLLQGRYKAILVEKESYLLELARYVGLNPVRAKLVRHPRAWRWNSYRAMAGEEKVPEFLTVHLILSQFHKDRDRAIREYHKFVKAGLGVKVWDELRAGVIMGTERFVHQLEPLLRDKLSTLEIPRRERLVGRPTLEELFSRIKGRSDRNERIYEAVRVYGYGLKEVGDALGLHYSTVSVIAGKVGEAKKRKN
ncbi:transposase [Candidatus Bipolaricaulota bacterium]|nr:transposase [Candidatus Bipolaricaulota bacterium]